MLKRRQEAALRAACFVFFVFIFPPQPLPPRLRRCSTTMENVEFSDTLHQGHVGPLWSLLSKTD